VKSRADVADSRARSSCKCFEDAADAGAVVLFNSVRDKDRNLRARAAILFKALAATCFRPNQR
jgi:hypothetical protein